MLKAACSGRVVFGTSPAEAVKQTPRISKGNIRYEKVLRSIGQFLPYVLG